MSAVLVREFPAGTYTGPPVGIQVGDEWVFCLVVRPGEGEPMCVVCTIAGDGRDFVPPVDMRDHMYRDCFGAMPFRSAWTGTLKLAVNVKLGSGNDRGLVIVDTGVAV